MRKTSLAAAAGPAALAMLVAAAVRFVAGCDSGSPAAPTALVSPADVTVDAGEVCIQPPMPDGGVVTVTGLLYQAIQDAAPDAPKIPVPNGVVSVEYGGRYVKWCDLSRASPFYVFGAVADDAGRFSIRVKEGKLGFHSFANDHLYGSSDFDTATASEIEVRMVRIPADQKKPTIRNARLNRRTADPGEAVTISAEIATYDPTDPLSDESILVEPQNHWSIELDPPSRGERDNFPDGVWRQVFAAPRTPGQYTYYLSATTSHCVTSDVETLTLTVGGD